MCSLQTCESCCSLAVSFIESEDSGCPTLDNVYVSCRDYNVRLNLTLIRRNILLTGAKANLLTYFRKVHLIMFLSPPILDSYDARVTFLVNKKTAIEPLMAMLFYCNPE